MRLGEVRQLAQQLMGEGRLDFLDLSLWDVFKAPDEPEFAQRPLIDWFTDLERGDVRLGVAGKIRSNAIARKCLEHGADVAIIGRAAILHHDFPLRARANPEFEARPLPVTVDELRAEGLGPAFVDYMKTWKGFVTA